MLEYDGGDDDDGDVLTLNNYLARGRQTGYTPKELVDGRKKQS